MIGSLIGGSGELVVYDVDVLLSRGHAGMAGQAFGDGGRAEQSDIGDVAGPQVMKAMPVDDTGGVGCMGPGSVNRFHRAPRRIEGRAGGHGPCVWPSSCRGR